MSTANLSFGTVDRVRRLRRVEPERKLDLVVDLVVDERGATMVMGIFIAVLLVGMIYYVWGIGDAIAFRERMQDASDTGAFSAAVIHARGMNMLALINMTMAVLAIISATLNTIAAMFMYAATAASLTCLGCGPWCASCCQACESAVIDWGDYSNASSMASDTGDAVNEAMDALHTVAQGVEYAIPIAAQAKVMEYGSSVYRPVTNAGIMAPIRTTLPAEDDDTDWPCRNKVWPFVAGLSPVGTVAQSGAIDEYLFIGIGFGEINAYTNSMDWCDGDPEYYFQRVTNHTQGSNDYQVQAYMFGRHDLGWTQRGVAIATWGQGDSEGQSFTQMAAMGNNSFAQAEFFYDQDEPEYREWLWHMSWRARLRRWRLSAAGGVGGVLDACSGDACGQLGTLVQSAESAVVH